MPVPPWAWTADRSARSRAPPIAWCSRPLSGATGRTIRREGESALGEVSRTHEFLDLIGKGDEIRDASLDLAVDVVDVSLLAVVGEQVPQIREVLEPVRERSLDNPVAGD